MFLIYVLFSIPIFSVLHLAIKQITAQDCTKLIFDLVQPQRL